MAKAPTSKRARSGPVAKPERVKKLNGKKNKKKKFWKSKAQEVSKKPENDSREVAVRPPKAPEDFSQNWKALQELLKQKPQTPEKPPVIPQMGSKKQPKINQQNRKVSGKANRDETQPAPTAKPNCRAPRGSTPSGVLTDRRRPALPAETSGAEHNRVAAKKRADGVISLKQGDIKHKKRKAKEAAPALPTEDDIWFDDVDPADIEAAIGPEAAKIARRKLGQSESSISLVKKQAFSGLTTAVAMDCEMVGVGPKGEDSIVARVSLVNQFGKRVYDKYVKPTEPVTDYRTAVSGIRPENLKQGEEFEVVQKEVAEILKGRILVGHALHNDLKVLFLDHPRKSIRDTQKYKPFKRQVKCGRPSLKLLSENILGLRVQESEHCSIQDAQVAMRLYVMVKNEWESAARDPGPTAAAPADDKLRASPLSKTRHADCRMVKFFKQATA